MADQDTAAGADFADPLIERLAQIDAKLNELHQMVNLATTMIERQPESIASQKSGRNALRRLNLVRAKLEGLLHRLG